MKRYVEKEEEKTTNKLSNYVGIVFTDGVKGVILNFGANDKGDERYHLITSEANDGNCYYGGVRCDGINVQDTLIKTELMKGCNIYCFDSYKEMMTWFAEGIKN